LFAVKKQRIYKTIILRVVLYERETQSLTFREEHRLRVFENRLLRKIFGPNRDEVMGGLRKLHNEELFDLYSLPSKNQNYQVEDDVGRTCVNGREEERI
jgi:hypothetical protein